MIVLQQIDNPAQKKEKNKKEKKNDCSGFSFSISTDY